MSQIMLWIKKDIHFKMLYFKYVSPFQGLRVCIVINQGVALGLGVTALWAYSIFYFFIDKH